MPFIRFNQIFWLLMALAFTSAFILPRFSATQNIGTKASAQVRGIFAPISFPLHRLGTWTYSALFADAVADHRPDDQLRSENDYLRTELVRLTRQLEELLALNSDRELLGDLRAYCTPMAVVGSDSGNRQTLVLRPALTGRLRDGLPVICPSGLVGRLDRLGAGSGAQVRLITDPGFRLEAGFRRFVDGGDGKTKVVALASTPQLVEGLGDGRMVIRNMTDRQVKEVGLQKGDWVVLNDRDYERDLQGLKVGVITAIGLRSDAPYYARIELKPMQNLNLLREVMVFDQQ